MRRFFNYAASAALSVLALASCAKEKLVDNSNGRELHFVVKTAESAPVKSYITSDGNGSYTPGWRNSDEIAIFTGTIAANTNASGKLYNKNEDGTKASFDGVVAAAESGVFKAIYPAGRVTNGLAPDAGAECVGVNLGDPENGYVQNPVAGSFDPLCDVLVSKPTNYNSDGASVEVSDVYFKRIMSVVKVVLNGADAADQAVSNFTMTADGVTLSGRAKVDVTNAKVDSWTVENPFVKAAFADNNEPVINSVDNNAFFIVVNPVTLPKDSKLTISAETASHYINKDITLPKDIVFPEGQMAVLNITINEDNLTAKTAESPKYILVKDVAEITAGSEVIIVADGSDYALGTTQNDNNRAAVSITKSSDKSSIDNISSDVQVFTVQKGTIDNTVAFYTGQGYIYAASSSENHLKTQDSIDGNASWTVSISSEGIATITAQGTNTHNILKKNNQSALFSCYSSGQKDVSIYKYSITALGQPANLQADVEGKTITVIWDRVENAKSYKVTCGDKVETTGETFYEFIVSEDGLYEISVVATTSDASFKDSAPATTTIRVGEIKKSKAYFSVNGRSIEETVYDEGTTISFPSNPSIPGVEFMGWTTSAIPTPQATAPVFVNTESTVMGAEDITFYAVFATVEKKPVTKTYGWETVSDSDWTISSSITRTNATTSNSANSGSYYGLLNSNSTITFAKKVKVTAFSYYCVRRTTNTNTSIIIQTSTDNSTWTDALSTQWKEFNSDSKTYKKIEKTWLGTEDVYVRLNIQTAANRQLDDVSISYVEINYTDYCTNVVTLSSILVSGTHTKTEYTVGETFDPTGLTVTGTYTDGSFKEITTGISWSSDPNPLTEGTTSVTVTATVGNLSAEYEVTGLNVTAGGGSGEGGGNTPAVGTILWEETWQGVAADAKPTSGNENTTVYDGSGTSLSYSYQGSSTKIYADKVAGGSSPELLIGAGSKADAGSGKFTAANIPTGGVSKMTFTVVSNKTVTVSVDGATVSSVTGTGSGTKTCTISEPTGTTISITVATGVQGNVRIDNLKLVVSE